METDDGPPPFDCVVEEQLDHPKTIGKIHSIDDDEDENVPQFKMEHVFPVSQLITKDSMCTGDDVSAVHSFSNSSFGVNERGDSTASTAFDENELNGFEKSEKENDSSVSTANENDDDDEWGEFGAATSDPPEKINEDVPPLNLSSLSNEDDDDDWGDFDQARPSTDRTASGSNEQNSEQLKLSHQQSLEEWGSFDNGGGVQDGENDDWQAEFTSALSSSTPKDSNLSTLDVMLEDDIFWNEGFDEDDKDENGGFVEQLQVHDIPTLFDCDNLSEEYINESEDERSFASLWLHLRVVEEALSLKFEWKSSENRLNQFKSLKINPNVHKKLAKSAFDTTSVLLPTPVGASTSTASSFSESSSKLTSCSTATETAQSRHSSSESPSVPVVDFDWDTSGLTNPLKGASQSSAIIDVDFLSSNGVASSYTNPLQKDFVEFGLNTVTNSGNIAQSSNIFDSIMSKASSNDDRKSPYRDSKVLSLDAQSLLDQLPDLEYLQSNMLMFPMGSGSSARFPK